MRDGLASMALESYENLLALDGLTNVSLDGGDCRVKGGMETDLHLHGFEDHEHLALCDRVSGANIDGPDLTRHGGAQIG